METIKLQIRVGDEAYGHALGEALKRNYSGFMVYLGETNGTEDADLVIFDDMRRKCSCCIYLVDRLSMKDEDKFLFYKYDSGKKLASGILSAYSRMTGRKIIFSPKHRMQLIAVHSASGGSGCTSVALAISQELQRFQGERTLYLSLEEFVSAGAYFPATAGKGIKEYLYYIMAGTEDRYSFPEEFLNSDEYGIETIKPFHGRNPITELSEEDFRKFFSVIISMGRYDAVILDCGNNTSEGALCAMKIADKLLFLRGDVDRDESYLDMLAQLTGKEMIKKMVSVANRFEEITDNLLSDTDESEDETHDPGFSIAYDPGSFKDSVGRKTISLDTDFGMDIKNLLESLRD